MVPKHRVNGGASYKTGCLVRSNCEGWKSRDEFTAGRVEVYNIHGGSKRDKLFAVK